MNFKEGEKIKFYDDQTKKWVPAIFKCIHSFPNIFLIRTKGKLTVAVAWLTK